MSGNNHSQTVGIRARPLAVISTAIIALAVACADGIPTDPPISRASSPVPAAAVLTSTAETLAGDPAPSADGRILFDTRTSLQQASTLGEALAIWGYSATTRTQWGFTTNMDGGGTRALRVDWTAASGLCTKQSPEISRTFPTPYPKRVYMQWKQRLGRTETGGGLGEVGQFDVFRPECGNTGRYIWMSKLEGTSSRIEVRWRGPRPARSAVVVRGALLTAPAGLGIGFDPQEHTGQTLTHTLYVQAQSSDSVRDGVIRLWVNGELVIDQSGVATGDDAVYRVVFPWTSSAPSQNQSEYFWDIVAWEPSAAPPAPVPTTRRLVVSPGSSSIPVGDTTRLSARFVTDNGEVTPGEPPIWHSPNESVATVSSTGLVTGVAAGSVSITATSEGQSASSSVTITSEPAAVATVSVSPGSATVPVGQTVQLTAVARDSSGAPLANRAVTWASSNTSVATVATDGKVSALAAGSATITATSEGKTGSSSVTVEAQAPPPPPPDASAGFFWISEEQIRALPATGPAWDNLKRAADSDLSDGVLSTRDDHNVRTMAAGLVAARLNSDTYRARVRESLRGLMANTISGSDPLAIVRRLGTYAIAADLINLKVFDPGFDGQFRAWLDQTRKTRWDGETIAAIHERRPNNWGTHAGVSRIAVALYLGDRVDLERAAAVYKGWLGDRASYAGFTYGDNWWQADPANPVGINPKGSTREGHSIDGVLPDDQRRAGGFTWPPQKENYIYTALEGALGQAVLLSRQNYDVWNWSDRALLRAFVWLHEQANYPAVGNDCWQPYIINLAYGTSFPTQAFSTPGKNVGWADWSHQR